MIDEDVIYDDIDFYDDFWDWFLAFDVELYGAYMESMEPIEDFLLTQKCDLRSVGGIQNLKKYMTDNKELLYLVRVL